MKEKKSAHRQGGMFQGANPIIFQYAKSLRKSMTAPEMLLWGHLKSGLKGYKFRRQHPIGSYIADLYCHRLRLVIEVDGSIHSRSENKMLDIQRETELKQLGCSTIRFSNHEVTHNLESVLDKINAIIECDLVKADRKKTNNI